MQLIPFRATSGQREVLYVLSEFRALGTHRITGVVNSSMLRQLLPVSESSVWSRLKRLESRQWVRNISRRQNRSIWTITEQGFKALGA